MDPGGDPVLDGEERVVVFAGESETRMYSSVVVTGCEYCRCCSSDVGEWLYFGAE